MTTLHKTHPFIIVAKRLEKLEAQFGVTEEIIDARKKLKEKYPEYFEEYMRAKNNKQQERIKMEKAEKEIQMRERGCETVSYWKKKKEEQKRKSRLKIIIN